MTVARWSKVIHLKLQQNCELQNSFWNNLASRSQLPIMKFILLEWHAIRSELITWLLEFWTKRRTRWQIIVMFSRFLGVWPHLNVFPKFLHGRLEWLPPRIFPQSLVFLRCHMGPQSALGPAKIDQIYNTTVSCNNSNYYYNRIFARNKPKCNAKKKLLLVPVCNLLTCWGCGTYFSNISHWREQFEFCFSSFV